MESSEYRSSLDPPGAEASNGLFNGSSSMIPMEIDEEMDSLVHETGDFSGVVSKLTHRKKYHATTRDTAVARVSTGFRGLFRTRTAYTVRNVIFIACLGWLVLLFIGKIGETLSNIEQHNMQDEDPRGPHQSSFGGIHNTGHPAGAKAHHTHDIDEDALAKWIKAEDNIGVGVKSLTDENILNHNGHYWHDPYRSPFSSHLYNRTQKELDAEQKEFDMKMNATKERWGSWNLVDTFFDNHKGRYRPRPDFRKVANGDLPLSDFPVNAWQLDEEYVAKFIDQARSMIDRVREGIYAHYYHPTVYPNGTKLTGQSKKDRDVLFQVIIEDYVVVNGKAAKDNETDPLPGIAYLSQKAWDGLVRKLLHSLVTNDNFFVVMAGDEAAAGHLGNNFLQTSIMQFHFLMEPVFDFLGMKLVSRNMAMTQGTTFSALGGAEIFGESDIMWYFSPRKQETRGQLDLLHKQAILSGERVPILLTPDPVNIEVESNGAAWVGNLQPGAEMCELSTSEGLESIPSACQLLHCPETGFWSCEDFNSVCWVDRIDFDPPVKQDANIRVPRGVRVPGPRKHKLEGHKLSLLLLHALDAAFDNWVAAIESDGFPLVEEYWHVGSLYKKTREAVRTHIPRFNENVTECDVLFEDFPIVCHVEMHAFTEWTPRVNPYESSLSHAMHPMMDTLDFEGEEELYEFVDVLPLQWKVPADQVDVHAIAISTSVPPLEVDGDDNGYDFDDDFGGDDMPWLEADDDWIEPEVPPTMSATVPPTTSPTIAQTPSPTSAPTQPPTAVDHEQNNADDGGEGRLTVRGAEARNETITPGIGWMVYNPIPGFCDGSAQSTCNRSPTNTCLLAGHNDFEGGVLGDGLSGWLMLRIHNVREGIILARFDTTVKAQTDTKTEGWTSIDQGDVDDNSGRYLNIPADFEFDYAINGKVTTMLRSEFLALGKEIVDGMTLYPLLLDESMSEDHMDNDEGRTIDVAIRIRSAEGRDATILLTHLYYA